MPNHLVGSTSLYLQQHQDQPVDWYPWGEAAFALAAAKNKPIFLSIGYSSCHWCHVMAHESFDDPQTAAVLNEHYVCVKVDREERPDLDEAYMTAVQLASGRGGWPMTLFLTPEREPFFAGTYFPPQDRGEHPGFRTIATQIAKGWESDEPEFRKAAGEFGAMLKEAFARELPTTFTQPTAALLRNGVHALSADFDPQHGGFGPAPKFPPHTAIELLMSVAADPTTDDQLGAQAFTMAIASLQAMAIGGLRDHVGGGFHRYSTDREWLVPHFEKMLSDNALHLMNYAVASHLVPEQGPFYREVAIRILDWLHREMKGEDGLFYAAVDADSEGEEGRFYVWSVAEIRELLGDRADAFIEAYNFTLVGNFDEESTGKRTGFNIPYLESIADATFAPELEILAAARAQRPHPQIDKKALVGLNGWMVGAQALVAAVEPAVTTANALLEAEIAHGYLPRLISDRVPVGDAYLEDYAGFIFGLLLLAEATGDEKWQREAIRLTDEMVNYFYDEAKGGFFATSSRHEQLFGRTKPVLDNPGPSANSLAIRALIELGDQRRAFQSLKAMVGWMERAPSSTEGLHLALWTYLQAFGEVKPLVEIAKPVESAVEVGPRELIADANGQATVTVTIQVPEGMHINCANPSARWMVPTSIEVQGLRAEIAWPEPEGEMYVGTVTIPVTLQLSAGAKEGEFEITVNWQTCTDSECLKPRTHRREGIIRR